MSFACHSLRPSKLVKRLSYDLVLAWIHGGHRVLWTHRIEELQPGDLCFYLSCGQIVSGEVLAQFRNNLVVHESDLPSGKGWSPLT